ncbi:MAG: DUF3990 domain-containing protein [Prevotellaceae bacterium]|jgi:hypothetical protein|nr:DUF3990 domain-containing protein [Prevotellaceae bacterium]
MQVYHGSYTPIEDIDLSKCQLNKDFGQGFYVTKYRAQAESWAEISGKNHDNEGFVTEFTYYDTAFTENLYKVKHFEAYNDEWLDFVIMNRNPFSPNPAHDYDIVEGPVVDDKVQRRITRYLDGEMTREEFFRQLTKYPEPTHQICFCTQRSLLVLKKTGSRKDIFNIEDIGEKILEQLILDFDIDEDKATDMFFSSATFEQLSDKKTDFYQKSWQEIYDTLKDELKK